MLDRIFLEIGLGLGFGIGFVVGFGVRVRVKIFLEIGCGVFVNRLLFLCFLSLITDDFLETLHHRNILA